MPIVRHLPAAALGLAVEPITDGVFLPFRLWKSDMSPPPSPAAQTSSPSASPPLVGVVMGSRSDWDTMERAAHILSEFGVPHECEVVSAHRTPEKLASYAASASERGLKVIIAGAGGAAHLPGMLAAQTILPVLGVPVESKVLRGVDSLLSIVQMPAGVPVATLAIGRAGATNAGLLAIAILAVDDPQLREKLEKFRREQTDRVMADRVGESLPGGQA